MTRTVVATGVFAGGGGQWREYNDGARAYWATDPETGKTVATHFNDGKGHVFDKDLRTGIETYHNYNAGTHRVKNLNTGEVRFYGPGGSSYKILRSGDTNA